MLEKKYKTDRERDRLTPDCWFTLTAGSLLQGDGYSIAQF